MNPPELRPHQRDAVDAVTKALEPGGRAQAVMAMGTGKTLVGRATADRLLPGGGTVAVLVPSLALISQTLRGWRDTGDVHDVLAVCSADDPGEAGACAEDTAAGDDIRWTAATTDPAAIAGWLAAPRSGMRLLLATYQSVPRIAGAFKTHDDLPLLDLVIFDEAHRAAADPEAPFSTALHDDRLPASRRLFLTATPRLRVGDPDDLHGGEVFPGMNDEGLFGPRVYELDVAEAIEKGLLSDYRVVVVGVTDAQVHKLVMDNAPLTIGPKRADAHTLATQIALAQAARSYDLRRILVFHSRVKASRDFAAVLPETVEELPRDRKPDGYLTVHHVDAGSSPAERRQALDDLAMPESGGWTVVSNVQVLSEGVDCPSLDAVVFASPREGQTSTIQAIGRALRLHPERDQPAVVLIPVYLAPGENGDLVAEDSVFRSVWQILRALRDRDANVGAALIAAQRELALQDGGDPRPVLPDWLDLHVPAEVTDTFLTGFATRLLDGTTHVHGHGMTRLLAFVDRYGHARPDTFYVDDSGFRIGMWAAERRRDRTRGILDPKLGVELESLPGWTWNVHQTRFDRMLAMLHAYADEHGTARPPSAFKAPDGASLGQWAHVQRRRYHQGRLSPEQIAGLEQVPGWSWRNSLDARWDNALRHLQEFAAEFGHADVDQRYRAPDGYRLGQWVNDQRRHRDRMPPARVRSLEAIPGWSWAADEAYQERMLNAVGDWFAAHGNAPVPIDYRPDDDPSLTVGVWFARMVSDYSKGRMPPELIARFEAVPGFVWGKRHAAFRDLLRRLADYSAEYGTPVPPPSYVAGGGYPLGQQGTELRRRHRQGGLPAQQVAALEQLPGWTWEAFRPGRAGTREQRFANALTALRAYVVEHGSCAIPPGTRVVPNGPDLGSWVKERRKAYREGRLPEEEIAALESVPGWYWNR